MTKSDDPTQYDIGKMAANARAKSPEESASSEENQSTEIAVTSGSSHVVVRQPANILQSSDRAWLESTQALQRNLIRQLQEARTSWREGRLIGAIRQQAIKEVTDAYVMFLREEAKMTSEMALEARRSYLERELLQLNSEINKQLADMVGKSIGEIEAIFQSNVARLKSRELQDAYAQYVFTKIFDMMKLEQKK